MDCEQKGNRMSKNMTESELRLEVLELVMNHTGDLYLESDGDMAIVKMANKLSSFVLYGSCPPPDEEMWPSATTSLGRV